MRDRFWLLKGGGGASPLDAYTIGGQSAALVFDRIEGVYGLDNAVQPIASVMPLTRASAATYIDSTGALATAAVDELRTDYDPVTLAMRGVKIELATVNYLLNSATLATQTLAVVDATTYTLHFTGTGSITLSGADATVLTGTGAGEADRVSATFTTVGTSLTVTVSGAVENAQLEVGSVVTSYIPTLGATATRAKETAQISTGAFAFSLTAGTFLVEYETVASGPYYLIAVSGGTGSVILYGAGAGSYMRFIVSDGASNVADINQSPVTGGAITKTGAAWQQDDFALTLNGAAVITDLLGGLYSSTATLTYGAWENGSKQVNGWMRRVLYYPARLTNADIEAWSAP